MINTNANTATRIEGRVAQLLNARELVINRGSSHGVVDGMKFAVLAQFPLEIRDPETDQVVGTIDREKVRVRVMQVMEKISICSTYRTKLLAGGALHDIKYLGFYTAISEMYREPKEVPETLEAKSESLPPPLKPEDGYVKINDRVIQVAPDEAEGR